MTGNPAPPEVLKAVRLVAAEIDWTTALEMDARGDSGDAERRRSRALEEMRKIVTESGSALAALNAMTLVRSLDATEETLELTGSLLEKWPEFAPAYEISAGVLLRAGRIDEAVVLVYGFGVSTQ